MPARDYDAILLDLDGTLVADDGTIHPYTRERLHAAAEQGVVVMIVTGRSEPTAIPAIEQLGIDTPAVIYNGAAVYCPRTRGLLEERHLDDGLLGRVLDYAEARELYPVVMCPETKLALAPRSLEETLALHDMSFLQVVDAPRLRVARSVRVSLFSSRHGTAEEFVSELRAEIEDLDAYLTWFPLNLLPGHRESDLVVIDVQPRCDGKAEAFRLLKERYGIPPERAIACGDATNDIPMLERAGLAVAMGNAVPEVKSLADRVIGANDTAAIGELVVALSLDASAGDEEAPWSE
ncbi:MAG: HAD family hydrolase [Planctomycetota bacterium]